MVTLYYFGQIYNLLVAGTGNKIEDFGIGFFTKYGDGGVDLSPIGDLTKTEVYSLAKEAQGYHKEFVVKGFLDDKVDALNGMGNYPPIIDSVEHYLPEEDDVFVDFLLLPQAVKNRIASKETTTAKTFFFMVHLQR